MKDLERKFFRYCCKNIVHDKHARDPLQQEPLKFREGLNFIGLTIAFSKKYGCSEKQLINYIYKWNMRKIVSNEKSL